MKYQIITRFFSVKLITIVLSVILLISCNNNLSENRRPNILIAMADDISYPHFGAYGCVWVKTPAIDAIAERGILFTNAYTPNAKCSPSRACLLTGRNSWQLKEAANHIPFFPSKFKTFMEVLKENGYHTGYTAKGWAPGNPGTVDGIPRELTGKRYNEHKTEPPATGISKIDYAANFKDFLDDWDKDKPFCFWYGSYEPHRGYEYESGVRTGGYDTGLIGEVFPFWPDTSIVRNDLLDYAFEINYFDLHLERMIDMLDEMGKLDNTLVIVTADNGMPFPRIKGQAYELSNHMPMAVMWPHRIKKKGILNDSYVSFIDIAPTLLETAGISLEESGMQKIEGKSILGIIDDPGRKKDKNSFVLIGKERHDIGRPDDVGYPVRGIIQNDYLYLVNFKPERWPAGNPETGYLNCDGSPTKSIILDLRRSGINDHYWQLNFGFRPEEELYNIKNDPYCVQNIADDPSVMEIKKELHNKLFRELEKQNDPRILGNGDVFDNYLYANEQHRDFYNRFMKGELDSTNAGWVRPYDYEPEASLR